MSDISEPALEKALAKLHEVVPTAKSLKIETKKCDVSKESDVEAMVAAVDAWGGLDIIFNNAGIMHADDDDAVNTPEKIWDLTQAINVKGVWFGSKHAVLSFRKHGKKKASVINTASVVGLVGSATPQLAYTASKGAVLAMTRELAMVHAREGFRFNSLCPAPLKYVQHPSPFLHCTKLCRACSQSVASKLIERHILTLSQHTAPARLARRRRREAASPRSALSQRPLRRGHRAGAGCSLPGQRRGKLCQRLGFRRRWRHDQVLHNADWAPDCGAPEQCEVECMDEGGRCVPIA